MIGDDDTFFIIVGIQNRIEQREGRAKPIDLISHLQYLWVRLAIEDDDPGCEIMNRNQNVLVTLISD